MGDEQRMKNTQITIFYSYADEDKEWQKELQKRLKPLLRRDEGSITEWHRGEIPAGAESEPKVREYLDRAEIILLLISPDFMNKHYDTPEVKRILERKFDKVGTSQITVNKTPHVIPIVVRSAYWKDTPFSRLEILPAGPPVGEWNNLDRAFLQVAYKIGKIIDDFNPSSDSTQKESAEDAGRVYKSKIPLRNSFFIRA